MAFLIAWSIQLGVLLWRRPELSRPAVVVAMMSLGSTPILLSFDLTFFAMAAYRAGDVDPEITQGFSDVAWIGSMLTSSGSCSGVARSSRGRRSWSP